MNILLLHQYFKTPEQGGGIRTYHIATAMVAAGHEVNVITSSNERNELKNIEGINVHYLRAPYTNHYSFLKRLWAFWLFYQKALSKSKSIEHVDLVYAVSTPLSVGWLGRKISASRNARFFFEVGDLWPEVPIQMGIIKNALLKKWLYNVEKNIYKSAELVIALSTGMLEYMREHGADKVIVVPNMADIEYFSQKEEHPKNSRRFTVAYFGTIGLANQIEYLVDIAELSQKENLDIDFLVVGDGARKETISKYIDTKRLKNITLLPWQDMSGVRKIMTRCDAVYISFQNISILHTGSPNKLFDGLAGGKMIVSNLSGWSKTLIHDHDLGISYNPQLPSEFIEKIRSILNDRTRLAQIRKNALTTAKSLFDKRMLTQRVIDEIS